MEWRLALTHPVIGAEEIEAVVKVLRSGWLTMGSVTASFEKEFAERMDARYALAVTNCTAALHLACLALGLGPRDEVICPALTFVATANAVRYTGATVVFADVVSSKDLTVSPENVSSLINSRTKAIIAMHYAGFSCHMDEIMGIAKQHGLAVIEDAAHAPFGRHRFADGHDSWLGTIGDAGCFSFFGNKNMTTGEGGMVVTHRSDVADKIRLLRSHGMTTPTYDRYKGHASGYDVIALGYNYRIDEIRSAIGLAQLGKVECLNERRRIVYRSYLDELRDAPGITVPFATRDLSLSSCHIMPIVAHCHADQIREELRKHGVQTSRHYDPVDSFAIYGGRSASLSINASNIITLPLAPQMTADDVKFVAGVIKAACSRH